MMYQTFQVIIAYLFQSNKISIDAERKDGKTEDKQLYEALSEAFEIIQKNAFYRIQIPKKLIPAIMSRNMA